MVSKRVVERKRGKWSTESLTRAFTAVSEGSSVANAAKVHNIPRKTLADYVKRNNSHRFSSGPKPLFTAAQETELAFRIKRLQQVGFPLT